MNVLSLAKPKKEKKPLKTQMIEFFILVSVLLFAALIIYICFDASVDREYGTSMSKEQMMSTSYKDKFAKLVSDIEAEVPTGIPTIDDAGVTYGKRIDITKGSGDFVAIAPSKKTSAKTYTMYNAFSSGNPINWSTSSNQYTFAYSKLIHQKSTLYRRSGVVKIFDRYSMVALGTYWSKKFGLPQDQGATYRVFLDNGRAFDVICFDVANAADSTAVNAPDGRSLGHVSGSNNTVITEFDILSLKHNYPVLAKQNASHPEMRYEELLNIKDDPTHIPVNGSLDIIPEFTGDVVALQLIDDPKIKDLMAQANEEVKAYKN